jgi:oligopeptide transport system substrate-binding protein
MNYFFLCILTCVCMACHKHGSSDKQRILRINLKTEPCSFDPRKGNDMVASQVHFLLFEGLVRLNKDMSITPALAKTFDISPDGKVYTFHLRDAVWSDGSTVTANDFEYSWKKILDPAFPSPDAYLLYAIKNAREAKMAHVPLSDVGIRSLDAKTLEVELENPTRNFLQIVASSVLLPISAKMEQKEPNWAMQKETILSNGPFCLTEWQPRHKISFAKNGSYHEAKKVKLDQILVDIIDREMPVLHMYASGHFDLVGTPLSFFPTDLIKDLKKSLTFFPAASTKFLAFNTDKFPFHNANIRRAFAYAISRKSLVKHVTELNEDPALNVISPVLMEDRKSYFSDGDVAKAKAFFQKGLEELQVESIDSPVFIFVPSEVNKGIVQALQAMWWKALGVNVTLQQTEFKVLHERSKKGDFSMGIFAWLADYADPMNILERFTDKTLVRNYPKWEHAGYRKLVGEMQSISSKPDYLEKVRMAEQILIDEMPFTCLFHENYAFLLAPHVKGFEISPLGHIYFEKISID